MLRITRMWVRTNIETPFFADTTPEFVEYANINYRDTGKRSTVIRTLSDDGLTMTQIMDFASSETFAEWCNDPIVKAWLEARAEYQSANGITILSTQQETI